MREGERVGDRFEVMHLAGSGGMGAVYRARDLESGRAVALKVLHDAEHAERFVREARLLAELHHPAIVEYVAHGRAEGAGLFLAMEWLDGEDLSQRLARAPLTVDESVGLVRLAAEALGAAHTHGVVHRDIKPSNLFLVAGDATKVRVLDFGIAQARAHTQILTRTGALLGTLGYMAPEQARGDRDLTPHADVFALGCVLFECLTGQPAFSGTNPVAVLAKVLLEDAPRLGELRADLAETPLEELTAAMLAKEPARRPADGRAVATALGSLGTATHPAGTTSPPHVERLAAGEQRLMCVILAAPLHDPAASKTITPERGASESTAVRAVAARFGAQVTPLRGSEWLLAFPSGHQALHAGRCALALATALPELRIAVATGRAVSTGRIPVGSAIERASVLLEMATAGVRVDDVTAGLLGSRFELRDGTLVGEQADVEARRLLGKETPYVGRDKELALLEATFAECVGDQVARSVLAVGPAGMGKSRLAAEFGARAATRGRVLVARADPMTANSPLALAREIVRRGGDIRDEFLAELVGDRVPSPSERLRAARGEPAMMREHKRRAFVEWVGDRLREGPLVLVLEDLHWGDAATIGYLDEAMRTHADAPLMVLALARPEVREVFRRLWEGLQEITLSSLTRRASERLVRAVLGDAFDDPTVARLVDRAEGNAFYLEELIRYAALGRTGELPETVLAMVEGRLERLDPEARRTLRAASVFGETFRRAGVEALAGSVDLETLLAEDLVVAAGGEELRFRHALVRDAAYATLPDDEKPRAHRLAAEWLERSDARDARSLAEHWERAGENDRAIPWLVTAGRAALDGGDFDSTLAFTERGIRLGATGQQRGLLLALQGEVQLFHHDMAGALATASEARTLLAPGTSEWSMAAATVLFVAQQTGNREAGFEAAVAVMQTPSQESSTQLAWALSIIAAGSVVVPNEPVARAAIERLPERADAEPGYRGPWNRSRLYFEWGFGSRLDTLWRHAGEFRSIAHALGHPLWMTLSDFDLALVREEFGDFAGAMAAYERTTQKSRDTGAQFVEGYAAYSRARCALVSGQHRTIVTALLTEARALGSQAIVALATATEAELHARDGDHDEAARIAGSAGREARIVALPVLAQAEIRQGRPAEALARIDRFVPKAPVFCHATRANLLALRAEALRALDRLDEAHAAIRDAREHVHAVAATAADDSQRESYLTRVPAVVRALALAREWIGEA